MNTEAAITWHRLSPLSVLFFTFTQLRTWGFQALPGLVVAYAAIRKSGAADWVWLGIVLLLVFLGVYSLLSYLCFRYSVAGERVLVRKGVLHREALDIDFERIQNINIREPFYMRPFGLAVMGIDTAGSAGKEVQLAGVKKPVALAFRQAILDRVEAGIAPAEASEEGAPDAGAEPQAAPGAGRLLIELSRRDVLIHGLTANFMLWLALAIGFIFGTGDTAENVIGWVIKEPLFQEAVESVRQRGGNLLLALATLVLFFIFLLALPVISMIGSLFRYDGFRLEVEDDTYRKSSGLLTRHDESLRQHKIQAVVWKQNAIARLLGRISLQLRQASAGIAAESGQLPTGGKAPFVVPSVQPAEAERLTAEFLPGCHAGNAEFSDIDRRRYTRLVVLCWTLPALGVFAIPALVVSPWFLAPVAVVSGLVALISGQVSKRYGLAVDGDHGFLRQGFIGQVITVFPMYKVQRVDIRQTPLQERSGRAHLTVHLASHSLSLPYVPLETAQRFRDLALYRAETTRKRWY